MINLVVDLSNIFFRSLFVTGGYGKHDYTFENHTECEQLMRKVATDISFILRQVNPTRAIFCVDDSSWRKDIPIEENEGYKGNRVKSKHINWDNVFGILNELINILDINGFVVSRETKAEADDLIALWSHELVFHRHQNVIIASGDEDVRQLVTTYTPFEGPEDTSWCTVYNPFTHTKTTPKKLYHDFGFSMWLLRDDEGDFMTGAVDMDKSDILRLRDFEKIVFEEIQPDLIALRKIFCGDDGDNVPAIYTWIKNNKEVRITNSKFEKIIEQLEIKTWKDLQNKKEEIKTMINEYADINMPFKIEDRLNRQLKLVVLNPSLFPLEIVNEFNNKKEKHLSKPKINVLSFNMLNMLENTKYISNNESSIFKEMDRINTKLF
jgi:hypothetical protein